jgi:hypothetical protein
MPFRSTRDLFPILLKNAELSAGKANVTAIIVSSALHKCSHHSRFDARSTICTINLFFSVAAGIVDPGSVVVA